ncbi:YczE/YyaS/YitT family protein [Microbacterium laevaniformans]|uniref:membrane protein YczE n=1 Tax=Microbacterium laevaniformans TaxID=36807 RepID=UPI003D98B809
MTARLARLLIGLILYGVGCGVMVQAQIGVDPWTVFAQGLSVQTGVGIGWITNLVGLLVLLLWIPLRQRPGIGTLANILLVGTSMQLTILALPAMNGFVTQVIVFLGGMALVALASGIYIGARLGPGPRDGLMTGMNSRLGWPVWACRLTIEATVLLFGWLLGGTVGLGTVLFAAGIGPLVHVALPLLDVSRRGAAAEAGPGRDPVAAAGAPRVG